MSFFFINKWIILAVCILLVFTANFLSVFIALILILIICILFFLLRKKNFKNFSQEYVTDNIFFLPISGKIKKINVIGPDLISILISIPFYKPWGVYAPSNCRVSNLGFSENLATDKNHQVNKYSGLNYEFIDLENEKISIEMRFLNRKKYNELVLNVDLGDQCSLGSNLGIVPWGGKLLLNISGDVKLNVKEGMKVHALETFLCKAN